jgi:CBS domain-containing protein
MKEQHGVEGCRIALEIDGAIQEREPVRVEVQVMNETTKKALASWGLSLLLLALGILVIWVVRYWVNEGRDPPTEPVGDTVLVFLLVMPILIYAIISGILKEFRGPGGWGASFNSIATTSVSDTSSDTLAHSQVSVDDDTVQILPPGGTETHQVETPELDETRPIVITVTFGKGGYTVADLHDYVEKYYRYRSFELVVFLTSGKQFVAFMPAWAAKQILNDPKRKSAFVEAINEGDSDKLYTCPGVVSKAISTKSTNAEALREMIERNSRFLVITDEKDRLKGIVEREQVIGKMVLALTP